MQTKSNENIEETKPNEVDTPEEERTDDVVPAQDLAKVVDELKEVRKGRAEYKEKYEALLSKSEGGSEQEPTNDVASQVEAVLNKRDEAAKAEARKQNLLGAIEKFKSSHAQFKDDVDGSKFSVIEDELKNFNLSNANSVEEFTKIIEKASVIAGVSKSSVQEPTNESTPSYTPTPSSGNSGNKQELDTIVLTDSERAAVKESGITEERALELKKKRPETFIRMINV